jgi:hypothetical protein
MTFAVEVAILNFPPLRISPPTSIIVGGLDDIYVVYYRTQYQDISACSLKEWPSLQKAGNIAEGVGIHQGSKKLIVSLTQTTLKWSSAAVSGGGTKTSDGQTAFYDWNGKSNTASQVSHEECSSSDYAPGFCYNYSSNNIGAHSWWLPSLGELMFIADNKAKINYALSLISGAEQLGTGYFISSTEVDTTFVWRVNMNLSTQSVSFIKYSNTGVVRPVTFY